MSGALWKVHLFILHKEVIILIWHGSLTFLALSCQDSQEESRKNRIASQYLIKYKLHSVKAKYHIGGETYTHTHTHTHFWDVLGLLSAWVFPLAAPSRGYCLGVVGGLLIAVASLVEHGLQDTQSSVAAARGLSSCGSQAWLLCVM